jgi:hypothetical protein
MRLLRNLLARVRPPPNLSGDFTKDQLDDYLRRVDRGLSEGRAAGAVARKIRAFRPAESNAFKPFKG